LNAVGSASKPSESVPMHDDPELMTSLSAEELEALAECILSPSLQARLEELQSQNREGLLSTAERRELDRLLQQVDQLAILKTRARYTLRRANVEAIGS